MPIYEYRCQACCHHFDALQKADEKPLVTCPECRKDALKKNLSAPAFHLKGRGWRSPASPEDQGAAVRAPRRMGHMLDSGPPHSHDDSPAKVSDGGHAHSHSGHTHASGHKHNHKH